MTLQEMIQVLAVSGKTYPLLAEVVDVHDEEGTVDVLPINEPEFFDVRVNVELSPKTGLKLMPKKGSKVFIIPTNTETGIVVLASELTFWGLKIASSTVEQTEEGLLIAKGDDTLRDALELIIDAVLTTVVVQGTNPDQAKLNQAKTKIQNLLRNAS